MEPQDLHPPFFITRALNVSWVSGIGAIGGSGRVSGRGAGRLMSSGVGHFLSKFGQIGGQEGFTSSGHSVIHPKSPNRL